MVFHLFVGATLECLQRISLVEINLVVPALTVERGLTRSGCI
jgi:hypothetical protein